MKDLISIIVPVYNVEKYVEKCLISIINQTYKNIEIIIVNDGSVDNSKKICESLKKKDKRIKLYNIKNIGLSGARNYGIEKSKGKYISFIDSDDYIDNNMIETLYNNLIKEKADISCCSFYEVFKDEIIKKNEEEKYYVMNKKQAIKKTFLDRGLDVYTWNKLYKKELFDNIKFPLGKKSQDRFVMYEIFDNTNKIVYDSICLYYYVQRNNSAANNLKNVNTDSIEASLNAISYLRKYRDIKPLAIKEYLQTRLRVYKKIVYYNGKDDIKIRKDLIREFKNYSNIKYTNKEKLELLLFKYFPNTYRLIGKKYYDKKYRKMI